MRERVFIIAEIGVNHDGDVKVAEQLIDAAADCGADAVKFQTFSAAGLAVSTATKAAYQLRTTERHETQQAMLARLELPPEAYSVLMKRATDRGLTFLSTPFDPASLALLLELGLPIIKIGSGDMTNAPLLLAAARAGRDLILSTGMASQAEVEAALGVLAFGYCAPTEVPSRQAFCKAWSEAKANSKVFDKVVLLHCTTDYPAHPNAVNLRAMDTLRRAFGLRVGYSDHTLGITISIAAAALGACVIEKHLTLDRARSGPDHAMSLEPVNFRALVQAIRDVEVAQGDGEKEPQTSECANIAAVRKSLVALRPIRKGEKFSAENLGVKRPGTGLSPTLYWDYLGLAANRDFAADDIIGR